jgi:hypothetical protein
MEDSSKSMTEHTYIAYICTYVDVEPPIKVDTKCLISFL